MSSFQQQLLSLPIPRVTTVLRSSLTLETSNGTFPSAARIITEWWNKKGEAYGTEIKADSSEFGFVKGKFKLDFVRREGALALAMEEPDSRPEFERDWICDIGLTEAFGTSHFELRLSYRQPQIIANRPEPRAPRLLRELLARVGARDIQKLSLGVSPVDRDQVGDFVHLLFDKDRKLPIIAISEDNTHSSSVDAGAFAKVLAGAAHTYQLTPRASWAISEIVGQDWSVFQGAVRCYNPGLDWTDDKYRHKLWLVRDINRSNASNRNGFLNLCAAHVFTQITAVSESLPLLSPSALRRRDTRIAEAAEQPVATPDFALVEPIKRQKARQQSLDLPVVPQEIVESRTADLLAEVATLKEQMHGLTDSIKQKDDALIKRDDLLKDFERLLEQERSSRAQDAGQFQEMKDTLYLYEQDNQELRERDALIAGGRNETSEALKPLWQNVSDLFQTMHNLGAQFRRLEQDSQELTRLIQQEEELRNEIARLSAKSEVLSTVPRAAVSDRDQLDRDVLAEMMVRVMRQKPTLSDTIECIDLLYRDRIEILPSARVSAEESSGFQYPAKAMKMLLTLATEYWEAIAGNGGDAEARKVFGTGGYAAKESGTLSKDGVKRRTFDRSGVSILMEKHLKIGTADNASDTLRIHFEWSAQDRKIIIGHCGRHLDF